MADVREQALIPDDRRAQVRRDEEASLARSYHAIFTQPAGRDVLKDLQSKFYFSRSCLVYVEGKLDTEATTVNEAQRAVVLYIMRQIQEGMVGEVTESRETHAETSIAHE